MNRILLAFAFVSLFNLSGAAAEDFSVTGSGSGSCGCTLNSCSCYREKEVRARCTYPSSGFISKLLKQQVTEYLYNEVRCQRVDVSVRVSAPTGDTYSNTSNGNNLGGSRISFTAANNDPFAINVTNINTDCAIEVPVTVTVRAVDTFGNSFRRVYRSSPTVRGVLK